jgi:hypothetical protein
MHMIGAQMIEVCRPPELLQQALEHWADCRERAVARLELKIRQLEDQRRTAEATRLRSAAKYLREAAVRDRGHAAELRRAAQL